MMAGGGNDQFGIGGLVIGFIALLCILPFGIWKIVELIWWAVKHIHVVVR